MRAVIQRVKRASVTVDTCVTGKIDNGLCVFVGIARDDAEKDVEYIAEKLCHLRIFPDPDGKMNRSVLDASGGILIISQFTLCGDVRKGRRPAFTNAMEPSGAESLYNTLVDRLREKGVDNIQTGVFRADMDVDLVNDGPVTILLDSRRLF